MNQRDVPIWELPDDDRTIDGLDEYGEPDPTYAAALGMIPAPLGRRAAAAVLDGALYCLLQVPYWVFALPLLISLLMGRIGWYGFLNHPNFILAVVMASITTVLTIAFCVIELVLHGRSGVTFGKALTGIRSVNVKTLSKPGFWRVTLRALVLWGSAAVVIGPVLFLLSPLFDPQKRGRGWHDVVGQTWLVDVRHGLHPYDEKRMRIARKTVTAAPAPRAKALPSLATEAGEGDHGEYRPAARTSAGVLGVARPHGSGPRPVVGLTGLEPSEVPPVSASDATPGRPVIGGYLASQPDAQEPRTSDPERSRDHSAATHAPDPAVASADGPLGRHSAGSDRPVPASAGFVVTLDTGDRVEVTVPVVVGRMPSDADGARRLPVTDDSLSVSKTHLVLRPVEHGVEVVDQGSTNGTAIVHDGAERLLEPGEPAVALPGDTIRFGDRTAVVAPT